MSGDILPTPALRLVAFDAEDLAVISAHVQDAELSPASMTYLAAQQRFVLVLARYDWQAARAFHHQRVEAGLHFDCVTAVATQNITRELASRLTLRAITFKEGRSPSGAVLLSFAHGGAIRLNVECIDAQLRDMQARWSVSSGPALSLKGETEFGA